MKKSKRFLSLLLAVVMAMSLLLMTGMADNSAADDAANAASAYVKNNDTWDSGVNGLKMHKEYVSADNGKSGTLKLEAYVTGESQTTMVTQPVDTVLVLDTSASMWNECPNHLFASVSLECSDCYRANGGFVKKDSWIYVTTGAENLDVLDKEYGGEDGIYRAHFDGGVGNQYRLRYNKEKQKWEYYKKVTIGDNWTDVKNDKYSVEQIRITKLDAMKIAAKHFIDSAVASSDPNHPNRIAIVSYATKATTVMELTDVTTGAQDLKNAIDGLKADGGTHSDLGLQNAQKILTGDTNKKVAIMFTDGEPGLHGDWDDESLSTANNAIKTSKAMKTADVTVYTVGCFSDSLHDKTKTDTYMNYVSSNYPNATDMDHAGADGKNKDYYRTASTSADLSEVFNKIAEETGGASYTLNSAAVMQDVVSQYFDFPEGFKTSDIEVYTQKYKGGDQTKDSSWDEKVPLADANITVNTESKTVSVSNFDYTANWVGSHSGKPGGKKIVVQIPIVDNKTGYGTVPTNTDASGIYKSANGDMVKAFVSPTVCFPYYQVAHVQGSAVVKTDKYRVEPNSENVTLTDKVTDQDNYLYGGGFLDKDCTTPSQNGKTGFTTPGKGETYYIREVSNKYLRPSDYDVWQHTGKDAEVHVTHMYMLAPVDCLNYRSVGFLVERNGKTTVTPSQRNGEDIAYGVVNAMQSGSLYDQVYVKDGVLRSSKTEVTDRDAGYISMSELADASFFNTKGATVTFLPYWVTRDGVMVTGTTQSTCTNLGIGKDGSYKWLGCTEDSAALTADANVTYAPAMKMLSFCKAAAFETDPAVLEAQTVTITVNDNGSVTTVNLDKGDLTGKLMPAGADGKVFAGWYTDEACTVPADFSDVQSDMTVYAKYVSGAYLSVKYKQVGVFRVRSVTLLSAVDSKDYQDSGYIINGEQVSCTNYKNRYGIITARMIFGRDVSRSAQLMTYSYATTGLTKGDTIEIVPYWVTLDGTLVTGTARTLTYNVRGLNG